MTLKFRRILYISFILLFLIISPLVCLYASGFDFNFKNLTLQKTGILIIDSDPDNAQITVKSEMSVFNLSTIISKILNRSDLIYTPSKIKKLLPGDYSIKVEKPDYWPWEKKLTISPGQSTFAENIILFKKGTPILASEGNVDRTIISNYANYSILDRGSNAILLSLSDANELWPTLENDLKTPPSWSPDDKNILVGNRVYNVGNILADYNSPPSYDLSGFISTSSQSVKWGYDNNIFFINNSVKNKKNIIELIEVDIGAKSSQVVFSDKNIVDYLPASNRLYSIERKDREAFLNIYDGNNHKLVKIINLPAGDYKFRKSFGNYLVLSDSNSNIYILDPDAPDQNVLRQKVDNALDLVWEDKDNAYYFNDFEIWHLDLSNGDKKIITRISSKINSLFDLSGRGYLIYSTEKNIYALELDDRDHRSLTDLLETDGLKLPILNIGGDTIYFYAKINGVGGYYKLSVR